MEENILKRLEEQLGSDWKCFCGGSFETAWAELVSKTKDHLLVRYSCRICGREQMLTVSAGLRKEAGKDPIVEVPNGTITSDDVLDIKEELATITSGQVKALDKKKKSIRTPITKLLRR